jgi:hypothetical protein
MVTDDIVGKIIEFENGEMTLEEVVTFFTELRDSGLLWKLQGFYQRTYAQLIADDYLPFDEKIAELVREYKS